MPVFIIKKPRRWNLVRQGECVQVCGRVRLMRGEKPVTEVYIKVGNRRLVCDFEPVLSEGTAQEWRFEAVYRVGIGMKVMTIGWRYEGSKSDHNHAKRFLWARSENVGPRVRIPMDKKLLGAGINVVGPLQYETGLGEAARGSIKALKAACIPHTKVTAPLVLNAPQSTYYPPAELARELRYHVNLFHLNGPEMGAVHKHWPGLWRSPHYNVAFWVFELEHIPGGWMPYFKGLSEIWAPSTFARDAIASRSPVPVHVVPTPVELTLPQRVTKAEFGLPEESVCVLMGFDLNSYRHRKNPDAAVEAFKLAWEENRDLHLILKIGNADKNWQAMKELRNRLINVPNVVYITEVLSREKMTRLQAACDIYLSLHRSEGFGLHLTECMALGKPVVATDWSANRDYLDEDNGVPVPYRLVEVAETFGPYEKGQLWAEADVEYAGNALLALAADPARRADLGARARARVNALYSVERVATAIRARFQSIAGKT